MLIKTSGRSWFFGLIFLGLFLNVGNLSAQIRHTFYVPLPEAQVHTTLEQINSVTNNTMYSVLSVIITEDNTIIYYDHWEEGYEGDITSPVQGTSEIWGDNNPANGIPPGYAQDILNEGDIIAAENNVPMPRNPSSILFDGRDKLASNKELVISKAAWALVPGTLLAGAVEVLDVGAYNENYEVPVGEDIFYNDMFEYVALLIMAKENGTNVQIDTDGNGSTDLNINLNEGESYLVDGGINSGATVTSTKPVQAHLLTGDINSTYEARWYTMFPRELWDDTYYSPVSTTDSNDPNTIFLYNPNNSSINIDYTTLSSSGTINVPANGVSSYIMPLFSGAKFTSPGNQFFAIGAIDSDSGSNQIHDWGFSLVPEVYLSTQATVGWGPGTTDRSSNASPVWVIAVSATTVYADLDGDPSTGPNTDPLGNKYDFSYNVSPYESIRIYDNADNDQTGMHVYTLDGTNISVAWGQDPTQAFSTAAGNPLLDLGTTVLPLRKLELVKTASLTTDNNSNGLIDPGDVLTYQVIVNNLSLGTRTNLNLRDTIPSETTYLAGTTQLNGFTIADDASPPAASIFPMDESGYTIPSLQGQDADTLTFQVTVNLPPPTFSEILNRVRLTTLEGDTLFAQVEVPVVTPTLTNCTLTFTDESFNSQSVFAVNSEICFEVDDNDQNTNGGAIETVCVEVQTGGGDIETVILTETGNNTGIFQGCIQSSSTNGQTIQDGLLFADAGDNLDVTYTDEIYGETCTDNATIAIPTETKPLYLSGDNNSSTYNLNPIKDSYVLSVRTDENQGGSNSISLSSLNQGLIEFDLSAIPSGTVISSAILTLERTAGTTNPAGDIIEARALTESWVEGSQSTTSQACTNGVTWAERDCDSNLSWTTAGGTYNGTTYGTTAVTTGTNTIDITTLVQAWLNGSLTNNGLLLRKSNSNSIVHSFSSRTGSTPPVLTIMTTNNQGMDRIDPVATNDNTTATSIELSYTGGGGGGGSSSMNSMVVYSQNSSIPVYREWDGSSFSSESSADNMDFRYRIMQGASSTTRDEKIIVGIESEGGVSGQVWDGSSWTGIPINDLGSVSETFWWTVDVAYESQSGDAVIVYGDADNLKFTVFDGSNWSSIDNINPPLSGTPKQIKLASNPGSDEITLVVGSTGGDYAMVWDGSSWGNGQELDGPSVNGNYPGSNSDYTDVNVVYEQQSGHAMAVFGTATGLSLEYALHYRIWNGSSWSAASWLQPYPTIDVTSRAKWILLDADANSDNIVAGVITSGTDGWVMIWNGSSWETPELLTPSSLILDTQTSPNVSVAFEGSSGDAIATYGRSSQNLFFYRSWTSGSGWGSEALGTILGANTNSMELYPGNDTDSIMFIVQDDSQDLHYTVWNGFNWSSETEIETSTGENKNQPYVFLWEQPSSDVAESDTRLSFIQTTPMCSELFLPVGNLIEVTLHVNVTSGTMPANPNVLAYILKNGTFKVTEGMTNAVYNSGAGTLTLSGPVIANNTFSAGDFVVLSLSNGDASFDFEVLYDSQTYPSKIELPTNTVIEITEHLVYDAPYSGGVAISEAMNGETVYVRTSVTDPFGYTDITSLDLTITSPSGGVLVDTVLTDAEAVDTTGCFKIYEFPWITGVEQGVYGINVVAHEGYENIVDSAYTEIVITFNDLGSPCQLGFADTGGNTVQSFGPNEDICVRLTDIDQDLDVNAVESITVLLTSLSGDSETLTLTETGISTGTFEACITTSSTVPGTQENGVLFAPSGDFVTVTYTDPNEGTDVCESNVFISNPNPDLGISKTLALPADGVAGLNELIRFDILISNPGPTNLTNITLNDTFDDSCMQFDSASIAPSSTGAGTLSWINVGPLAPSESFVLSVYFTATNTCNPASNTVTANGIDENSQVVSAGPSTAYVIISDPQLTVDKYLTDPPTGPYFVGDILTYQIDIANTGTSNIITLPLSDQYSDYCLEYIPPAASGAPQNVIVTEDNVISTTDPGDNFGVSTGLDLRSKAGDEQYGLLYFDFSGYAGKFVDSVTLHLNIESGGNSNFTLEAHRLLKDWDEGTANGAPGISNWTQATSSQNWTNPGSDYAATVEGSLTTINGWNTMTLPASLVQDWIDNPENNHGLVLIPSGGSNGFLKLTSSEGTSANRPYISFQELTGGTPADAYGGGIVLWNDLGYLPVGDTISVTVQFQVVNSCDPIVNTADVSFAVDEYYDPVPPDNGDVLVEVIAPPVAIDDYDQTDVDTPVTTDVLVNDSDPNDNIDVSSTTTSGVMPPANGGTSVNTSTGEITYTPDPGFSGIDQYEYIICDSTSLCDTALVTIYINCPGTPGQNIITGSVFQDINLDGVFFGSDVGRSGVTVNLYEDVNQNGQLDGSDVFSTSDVTDVNGDYSFNPSVGGSTGSISVRVASNSDDVEETSGSVSLGGSFLDMGYSAPGGSNPNLVGIRFQSINIPVGATITSARVDFVATHSNSETTNLTIRGDADATPDTFNSSLGTASNRTPTTASVSWNSIPSWTAGSTYSTPDISSIIQEIVDLPAWSSGNNLALLIDGTGNRRGTSHNNNSSIAPLLVVDYVLDNFPAYFVMEINTADLPSGYFMTTDSVYSAAFTASGQSNCNNDFGYNNNEICFNGIDDDGDGLTDCDDPDCPAPTGIDDTFSGCPETAINGDVSTNDISSGSVDFAVATNPSSGSLSFNSNGTFTYTPNSSFCGNDSFTYSICYTISACCDTATVNISIEDSVNPVLSGVPADVTVECDAIPSPATVTATDNCDPSITVSYTETNTPGSCDDEYTLTRVWTATDVCGNSTSGTQIITVEDNTDPVLSGIPSDITITNLPVPDPPQIGVVITGSDNCGSVNITLNEVSGNGCNYTVVRTWTATDDCGNQSTASQTITVDLGDINAGSVNISATSLCLPGTITGTPDGTSTIPSGYSTMYFLVSSPNYVIDQMSATPSFAVTVAGNYSIYTLVYSNDSGDANYLDLSFINLSSTTIFELIALIEQGGGNLCASLDMTSTPVLVENCVGTIGDYVWDDNNKNGIQDGGESGIEGVKVYLYDGFNNLIDSTLTDNSGNYQFSSLSSGAYYLKFNADSNTEGVDNFLATQKDSGTNDALDSDIDLTNNQTDIQYFDFNSGNFTNIDAGFYRNCTSPDCVGGSINNE